MTENYEDQLTYQDLSNAVAVIVTDPNYDGSMVGWTEDSWKDKMATFDGLMEELETKIEELAPEGLLTQQPRMQLQHYQIGPASQGPTVEIILLVRDIHAVVQAGIPYLELGAFALGLGRWWKNRSQQSSHGTAGEGGLAFTASLIEGMCVADVVHRHGESRLREVRSHSREQYFASPAHPTGSELYTVAVSTTRDRHYMYLVSGNGVVVDHFVMEKGEMKALDNPIWISDSKPDLSTAPKRPHAAALGRSNEPR